MKKIVIGIVAVVALVALISGCGYNGLVKMDEEVKNKWSNVEAQYQRRSDLIPNLVSTVKGAAKFEQSTLTAVIEARASASKITIDPDKLNAENIEKYQQAQGQITQALGKLMVLTENYPELKATQQFSDLSAQLEGTENRVAQARRSYNETVTDFNRAVRRFPRSIVAGIFGFEKRTLFEAAAGADVAPTVDLNPGG